MAVTSTRSIVILFTGDVISSLQYDAVSNLVSPGQIDLITLSSGNNTITAPVVTGMTFSGVTIIPPSSNTELITLKGVNGDTGIALHLTDPTSLALDSTLTNFVLNAANDIAGVRLIWS